MKRKHTLTALMIIFCMVINMVPAWAAGPPPGYTQVTEAGGTGTTNISIKIEGSGSGGSGGEDPDNPGGGGDGEDPENPGGGGGGDPENPGGGGGDDPNNPGGGEDDKPKDGMYTYLITYHYDESVEREAGQGKKYDPIPYDMTTPKSYTGHNWVLERFSVSKFITEIESNNVAEIWYTLDDKDADGNQVPGGDGIPDKYQDPEDKKDPTDLYNYTVTYNYEDEPTGQVIEGRGTVGSVIPYASPNTTTFNGKQFQFSRLEVKSNIVTPDDEQNKVNLDYNKLSDDDKDNVPGDEGVTALQVTFDPANGGKIETEQVTYGEKVAAKANPVKDGHVFQYWGVFEDGAYKQYNFDTPVTANLALVAQYVLADNTATYKVQHYQATETATVSEDEPAFPGYVLAAEETLTHAFGESVTAVPKTYTGFVEDTANTNRVPSGVVAEDNSLVLRLFYAKNVVHVTIDPDNGTEPTVSEIPKGATISTPATPEKEGFDFAGWTVDGAAVDFGQPINDDITIKGTWTEQAQGDVSYKVEHYWENLKDDNYTLHETETLTAQDKDTVKATVKTYTGFTENTTHPDRKVEGVLSKDTELTLKVFYKRNVYTVTIDPGNGGDPEVKSIKHGDTLARPDEPDYPGHTLTGWKDTATGEPVSFPKEVTGNMTIQGTWKNEAGDASYKVEHYWENLKDSNYTLHETETIDSKENVSVRATVKPYIGFTQNLTHPDRKTEGVVSPDNGLILKVFYKRNVYNVTIDPGNGEPPVVKPIKYGDTLPKPDDPNYPGHTINGWKDKDTGEPITFPKEITNDITITPDWVDPNVPLYKYTIRYHFDSDISTVNGQGKEGISIPYTTASTRTYNNKNYVYVSREVGSATVTTDASKNVVDVYYELDEMGGHGTVNSGDGTPDKYQIAVYFRANHGSVSHSCAILTKYDSNGNRAVNGTAKLASADIPTATANYGYRNGSWNTTPVAGLVVRNGDTFVISYSRIPSSSSGSPSTPSRPSRPSGGGGSSTPASPGTPTKPGTVTIDDSKTPLQQNVYLDNVNHIAYISGYSDGTIKPYNNITRAEVAMIIYRLMLDEYRDYHYTADNTFSDVEAGAWYNVAVSTDAAAGVLSGYSDGTFKPLKSITRGEFATIISRFFSGYTDVESKFTDTENHWAKDAIDKVASMGWVSGYSDGTFRPNNSITRAEAITIINRVLNRYVTPDHMLEGMKVWPDVKESDWFYEAVQEATNRHTYEIVSEQEVWKALEN